MRKNISTYNHQRFAQNTGTNNATRQTQKSNPKPNFKEPKYINSLLANRDTDKAVQDLIFLASRSEIGDDTLSKAKKSGAYDQTVFQLANINKIHGFFDTLQSDKKIDQTLLKNLRPKINEFLKLKLQIITQQTEAAGAGAGVTQPNQQVPEAPNMLSPAQAAEQAQITPEQADKYLSNIIPALETLSKDKEKPRAFTQRYSNEYNYIINAMSVLQKDPKFFQKLEGYNKSLSDLSPIYNNAMHPTGWTAAGNSVFVTDWYTLGDQIINDIQGGKVENANTKLTTFQTEFLNKNPKNTDISGVANKVNQFIDKYNSSGVGTTIGRPSTKLQRLK
jgi:hypothetical protein